MAYSIKTMLHPHINKSGTQQVIIRIISDRIKTLIPTGIKITCAQWSEHEVINHVHSKQLNFIINKKRVETETQLLEAIKNDLTLKDAFTKKKKSSVLICDFIDELVEELQGKLSVGRIRHYNVISTKLMGFDADLKLDQMDISKLNAFEKHLRESGISNNTIQSNMKIVKSILQKAAQKKKIKKDLFEDYKLPRYEQPIPEYLTEEEINKLQTLVDVIDKPGHKLAGYYFLLSCLTGYRISDAKRFSYEEMVKDNKIIIRAKKNHQIISIPIYPRLKVIIDFIKDKPFNLSEEKVRLYVKELCSLAGIKKNIKFHASRHSFAVMLMNKGFTLDEAAELLGDSLHVSKIYARITNEQLNRKVLERLN